MQTPDEITTDPVCGRSVPVEGECWEHTFDGVRYLFCSSACQTRFAADPQRWATRLSSDADGRS